MLNELIKKHKIHLVILSDIIIFALSALVIIFVRYYNNGFSYQLQVHSGPFTLVLVLWLIIFYISNLYTYKAFSNILEITKRLSTALLISFAITITIFYIFSRFFFLTPKANLVMLTFTFGLLDLAWRCFLRKVFLRKTYCSNVLMMASSSLVGEITTHLESNPQLGFHLKSNVTEGKSLTEIISEEQINLIIIDDRSLKKRKITKTLYELLPKQIEIITLTDFYESIFGCIPLSEVEESWFIREITENKNIYESIKRLIEVVSICLTLPVTIILAILAGLLVKITSRGPIIYKQERMGKDNKPFTIYKFRTMRIDAEGPLWTTEDDDRLTIIGKFLRHTHLDEIPQLLNVLKGDISFVGPRPERTKLVKLYETIPYYEIRHIIKPGIIGWAQLNYPPSTSPEEAQKKFQFDLYYLKNRSLILDLYIAIKTIRKIFV